MRLGEALPFERACIRPNEEAMGAYTKLSAKVLARADVVSERVVFWGLVSAAIVTSLAMLKGMVGYVI